MADTDARAGRRRRAYAARMPLEQRRQQLLDAARAVIDRVGYSAATVEAIACEAGVTKPVVYGAYESLSLLFTDLLDRTQADAVGQLLGAFPKGPSASNLKHLTANVTRAWAQAVRRNPKTWKPVLLTGSKTPVAVLERVEQGRELVREALAGLLDKHSAHDPETIKRNRWTAHAIVATAEHFGRLLMTDPDAITDDELAVLFEDLVAGLLRRSGRPAEPRRHSGGRHVSADKPDESSTQASRNASADG